MMATEAYFGNPNIARQGARARQIAQARNVSDIADPRTYGFMQGLLGSAPDQLGYSVFDDPETRRAAQQAAEVGLVGGGLLQSIPVLGPALKGYGRLAAGQVNRAMMGEGGLLGPITPQPMYVVPPGKKLGFYSATDVGKVFPTSISNKSEVKNVANDFADQFKQMGFNVTIDHSGSKAGASSYLRVSDPQTGRFLSKPIRISDHGKGAKELDANINVLNPQEDFAKITSALNDMRAKGDTLVFKQDKYAQELIASGVKPKTAYQRARTEIAENQPSPYPQQAALDLAQQRAALPVEQGGLGLPASNTPEMRAQAMGFDTPVYHATDVNFTSINPSVKGKYGAGVYTATTPKYAEIYAQGENARTLPLMARGKLASDDERIAIADQMLEQYQTKEGMDVPLWKKMTKEELANRGYTGVSIGKERLMFNPSDLRSRFAAFDPFRKDVATATAMGVALPDLLAAEPTPQPQSSGLLYPFP